jgi:hypothetical protein
MERSLINPVQSDTHAVTPYNYFQIIFLMVTLLFPIRVLLVLIVFVVGNLLFALASLGAKKHEKDADIPLSPLSRSLVAKIRWFPQAIVWLLGFYKIEVKGSISDRAPILVSNHISFVEGFVLAAAGASGLAKASMARIPLVAQSLRALEVDL